VAAATELNERTNESLVIGECVRVNRKLAFSGVLPPQKPHLLDEPPPRPLYTFRITRTP
jgi:hypothetical protein